MDVEFIFTIIIIIIVMSVNSAVWMVYNVCSMYGKFSRRSRLESDWLTILQKKK